MREVESGGGRASTAADLGTVGACIVARLPSPETGAVPVAGADLYRTPGDGRGAAGVHVPTSSRRPVSLPCLPSRKQDSSVSRSIPAGVGVDSPTVFIPP